MKIDNYQTLVEMAKSLQAQTQQNGGEGAPFIVASKPEGEGATAVAICANGADTLGLTGSILEGAVKCMKDGGIPYKDAENIAMKMVLNALGENYGTEEIAKAMLEKLEALSKEIDEEEE